MIGGNTRVNLDVPPFFLYSGCMSSQRGLNMVGLKRAGFYSRRSTLKKAYQLLTVRG